jgi:hypothetical protein
MFKELLSCIIYVNPVLVVFDSLVRLHRQQENDPVAMSSVMAKFRKIANCGPTVWVIHHHKKGDGPLDQKTRGSTDIVAGTDIEYSMVAKDGLLYLSSQKTRVEPFGPIALKLQALKDRIEVVYQGTEGENVLEEVLEILEGESLKAGEIHERLRDRGVEVGINKLREILKRADRLSASKYAGRGGGLIYSLKDTPLRSFTVSPYKGGENPLNLTSLLNGQSKKLNTTREAMGIDSQGLAEVSRVENEGGREAVKLDLEASRADEKKEGGREASEKGDDSIREPGEEG